MRGASARSVLVKDRLGLKTVHNVTVHSPLAAVGWPLPAEPPAGAHDDATSFCRTGPVGSRDAGDPLHRPDPADFPPARLQYGKGIHGFFCHHRGNQFVSSALMLPMTEAFAADIHHYIAARGLDLVGSRKARARTKSPRATWLAATAGSRSCSPAWPRRRPGSGGPGSAPTRHGRPYPWLCQEQAMVNHWYFYGFDADFGPFYIKFCGYFPFTGQIYLNGHEYAMRQCAKAGIAFTAWTTRSAAPLTGGSAADLRWADRSGDLPVRRQVAGRLPHPFTPRTSRLTTGGSCRSSRWSSPPP